MNTERIITVAVAVVVVLAIAFSASTLESSMTTDPEEAIDLDNEAFPLGTERGEQIQAATQQLHDEYTADSDQRETVQQTTGAASETGVSDSVPSDGAESSTVQKDGTGTRPVMPGIDVVSLLGVGLLWFVSAVVIYRYRRRLDPILAVLGGAYGDEESETERSFVALPENDVERAWAELLRRASVDQPQRYTSRICARRAIESGFDTDTVEQLRRLFEDVQYGAVASIDAHEQHAREVLQRLDGELR